MNIEAVTSEISHYFATVNRQREQMRAMRSALEAGAKARDAKVESLLEPIDIPEALTEAAVYLPSEDIGDAWEGPPAPSKPIDVQRLAARIAGAVESRARAYFECVASQHDALRQAETARKDAMRLGKEAAALLDKLDSRADRDDPAREVFPNSFADAASEVLDGTVHACDPDSVLDWALDPDQSLAPVNVEKATDAVWFYATKG